MLINGMDYDELVKKAKAYDRMMEKPETVMGMCSRCMSILPLVPKNGGLWCPECQRNVKAFVPEGYEESERRAMKEVMQENGIRGTSCQACGADIIPQLTSDGYICPLCGASLDDTHRYDAWMG